MIPCARPSRVVRSEWPLRLTAVRPYPSSGWANYLKVVHDLGQTKKQLATSDVISNSLAVKANKLAAKKKAASDAKAFKLNSTFQQVDPGQPHIG